MSEAIEVKAVAEQVTCLRSLVLVRFALPSTDLGVLKMIATCRSAFLVPKRSTNILIPIKIPTKLPNTSGTAACATEMLVEWIETGT